MSESCPKCFSYLKKGVCPNCGYQEEIKKTAYSKFLIVLSTIVTWIFAIITLLISFDLFSFWGIIVVILLSKIWFLPFFVIAVSDLAINQNPFMLILCILLLPLCKIYFDIQVMKTILKNHKKKVCKEFEKANLKKE